MKIKTVLAMALVATTLSAAEVNPFMNYKNWKTPHGTYPFNEIKPEHYMPAIEQGMKEGLADIDKIVNNPAAPTFQNTIEPYVTSGRLLDVTLSCLFNLTNADTNDELDAIETEVTPKLSEYSTTILLNEGLFKRIKAVYDQRESLGLNAEDMRLLTETYKRFDQNGANLPEADKESLKEINQELAMLSLKFGQNVVNETNSIQIFVTDENELSGLPESAKSAAKEEAVAAGRPDAWLFTPKRTSFTPVLQYCDNRALREQLLMAYTTRGNRDNKYDNKAIICRTMALRIEKAKLFGYDNPADYILQDCMAHNAKTVDAFLLSVWEPSLVAAKKEAAALQEMMERDLCAFAG